VGGEARYARGAVNASDIIRAKRNQRSGCKYSWLLGCRVFMYTSGYYEHYVAERQQCADGDLNNIFVNVNEHYNVFGGTLNATSLLLW